MKQINDALGDVPRLKRDIAASDFDLVIAASPENVLYTSDAFISTQIDIRDRLALIAWDGVREPVFVLCQVEVGYAQEASWIQDIRSYKEFVTSPIDILADVIRELGAERGTIGVEMEYLASGYLRQLQSLLPNASFGACEPIFDHARMFKTKRERTVLADAFRGTERALQETFQSAVPGQTEREMCFHLSDGILRSGAESVAFSHINGGANTGFPHKDPSDYQLRRGDILKADAGGRYARYYSNVGRTAKLGPLTDEDRSWWGRLREIHHELIDQVRPGNSGRELFEHATRLYAKHNIPFPYAHNGHSIGLLVHEHPLVSPHEPIAYEPGMMTTIETRVRWVGKCGYHMEDVIEVTEAAPIVHCGDFDNEEILVVDA